MNDIVKEMKDFVGLIRILFSFFDIVKPLMKFVVAALKSLVHPENVKEWRFAYAYFVFPVVFVGGAAMLVSAAIFWLLPHPLDWLLVLVWLFYILIGEPFMYYIEGNGFERWDWWIENGGEVPFEWEWKERA